MHKPRYYIHSGPSYIDHGKKFNSVDEAQDNAIKRAYWMFIYDQARIIQVVNPTFVSFCEKVKWPPPRPGMIWMGTPACKLQT